MSHLYPADVVMFFAGFAAGALYFAALWWSVRRLAGGKGWQNFILGVLLRLAALVTVLGILLTSDVGPLALLLAAAGFLAARLAAIRICRPAAKDH